MLLEIQILDAANDVFRITEFAQNVTGLLRVEFLQHRRAIANNRRGSSDTNCAGFPSGKDAGNAPPDRNASEASGQSRNTQSLNRRA